MVNKDEELGEVGGGNNGSKICPEAVTPVFEINDDGREVNEETRLTNRYLDLEETGCKKI